MQSLLPFHRISIVALSVLAFFFCNFNSSKTLWYLIPGLVLLYVVTGGWRFLRVVCLTFTRDLRGLLFIINVFLSMRRFKKRGDSVATLFDRTVEKYHDKIAFIYEEFKWTFCDVSRYSNAVAHYLMARNKSLKKGDVVALFMETRPEYVASWLGITKKGCVAALINFNQRNEALLHSIKVADSKAIICGEELLPALVDIAGKLGKSLPIYVVPKSEGPPSARTTKGLASIQLPSDKLACDVMDLTTLEQFFEKGPFPSPQMQFSDIIMYIYTSGTTGLPKAAKIASSRFWYMSTGPHVLPKLTDNEIVYVSLPIYHSNGGIIGVGQALLYGCTVVLKKKFSASQFWNDCAKYRCTTFMYIGEICRYLLAQPVRPSESQHCVKFAIGNGLRESIWRQFQGRFGIKHIVEFYGATEGNANAINNWDRVGAVGFTSRIFPKAYPIFLIKIDEATGQPLRDAATGLCTPCEPGEPGELIGKINSNNLLRRFDGYATTAETEKKIVRRVFAQDDMYFRTGDILVMDELGFFFFKDRTGDTFRWRGENVSTQEVEAIVSSVTGLRDAAVYGVEVPGVEGRAGMVALTDPKRELDISNGLAKTLLDSLPSYGVPMFIRVMETIPATGTYKFVKGSLQKEAFNPELVGNDPLYYLDTTSSPRRYAPLTGDVYRKILSGEIRI